MLFPLEVTLNILRYFDYKELESLRLINSDWKELVEGDQIWKPLCIRLFGQSLDTDDQQHLSYRQKFIERGALYKWDFSHKHVGKSILDDSCLKVTAGHSRWATVLASPSIFSDISYCEITMNFIAVVQNTIRITFGVTLEPDERVMEELKRTPLGYTKRFCVAYAVRGNVHLSGLLLEDNYTVLQCVENDRLGILVNRAKRYIIFFEELEACLHDLSE